MPGLLNPNLKIKWAKNHFDALEFAIAKFRSMPEKSYRISDHDDLESGFFVITIEETDAEELLTLGLMAGDFLCNLRSALDYLAWQLAHLTTDAPSRDICFPILGENSLDAQLRITRSTYCIPDEAVALMKSFQPYHRGNAYESTHLWRLNELWNVDKHRVIALHSLQSEEILWLPKTIKIQTTELDNGTVVRFPLSAKKDMRFNPNPGVDVRFGRKASKGKQEIALSIDDFRDIYEFVSMEVIPKFSRFFP